jgi:hypothetical protein
MDGFKQSPLGLALLVMGLVATVFATIIVTKVTMKALNIAIEEE